MPLRRVKKKPKKRAPGRPRLPPGLKRDAVTVHVLPVTIRTFQGAFKAKWRRHLGFALDHAAQQLRAHGFYGNNENG